MNTVRWNVTDLIDEAALWAHKALLSRLASQSVVNAERAKRDELYGE